MASYNYNTSNNYNNEYSGGYGGGFNAEATTGGGFNNSDSYGSQQKTQLRSTLTPVTIKQINDSKQLVPDGEFTVNNVELNLVSFVGVVRNVVDNTSSILITIEDGTGSIEVRKWVDEGKSEPEIQQLNTYVYVTGALKEFNSKKNLQHSTIRPISDHQEIIYHNLCAISHHLAVNGRTTKQEAATDNGNSLFVSEDGDSNSNSLTDKIFSFISSNAEAMPEGVPIQLIAQSLNLLDNDVANNCQRLVEEGRIFTGYDDKTYIAI